jgi:hypothetical protein
MRYRADEVLDYQRVCFLRTVAHQAPEVLADLRESVWPAYCRAAPEIEHSSYDRAWHPAHFPFLLWPLWLRMAVRRWGRRHHLVDSRREVPDWIRRQLEYTLSAWAAQPEILKRKPLGWWGLGGSHGIRRLEPQLPATRAEAEAAQLIPWPIREKQHFDWAVRSQVLGEKASFLAAKNNADVSSIHQAVKALLQQIGLAQRARRGRPKGQGKTQQNSKVTSEQSEHPGKNRG